MKCFNNNDGWTKKELMVARFLISIISIGMLIAYKTNGLKIDKLEIAFIVIAFLPWFSCFIEQADFLGNSIKFKGYKKQVDRQDEIINSLVINNMVHFIFKVLKDIYAMEQGKRDHPFDKGADGEYHINENDIHNLTFLRDNGYINAERIRDLRKDPLHARSFRTTEIGEYYIRLRNGESFS